jgi:hypothetical protein
MLGMVLTMLSHPSPIHAQNLRLGINPPLVEAAVKPGKAITIAYTISNLGDPMIVSSDVRSFRPHGIYGDLVLEEELEGPARFNLENSNIKLGQQFFLQSKEGQQLVLKIRIPEGTPEGDYYYTFYVQNDLGKPTEGSNAARALALVGSNILITVTESGSVDVGGSIGEFSLIPRFQVPFLGRTFYVFESTDIIPVKLVMQNTGRHLVKPHGSVELTGNFGEHAEYSILPQNVLSQSSRLVIASPSASLTQQSVKQLGKASLYISGFFVGKYTLTTHVNFGLPDQSQEASVEFYALPFKLLAAFGVALLFGIIVVKKFRQD